MCYPNFKGSVPLQNHSREGALNEMVEEGCCKQHTGNEARRGSETEMEEGGGVVHRVGVIRGKLEGLRQVLYGQPKRHTTLEIQKRCEIKNIY